MGVVKPHIGACAATAPPLSAAVVAVCSFEALAGLVQLLTSRLARNHRRWWSAVGMDGANKRQGSQPQLRVSDDSLPASPEAHRLQRTQTVCSSHPLRHKVSAVWQCPTPHLHSAPSIDTHFLSL